MYGSATVLMDTCMFSCHVDVWIAPKYCRTVADIDDTEVIWIALLRHAVFLPACLNKAIQITSVSSISATSTFCNIYLIDKIIIILGNFKKSVSYTTPYWAMISSLLHLVGLRPRVYYTLTNFRGRGPSPPPQYANA